MKTRSNRLKGLALKILRYWWTPSNPSLITLSLTAIILAVYALTRTTVWNEASRETLGLQPGLDKWYTYLTYAILHGDLQHVAENSALLILLGPSVERMMGKRIYTAIILGLCLLGALAATTFANNYWPSDENPVGLSNATFALITAWSYIVAARMTGHASPTPRQRWRAVAITAVICAALMYGALFVNAGPALMGHVTAFIGGTIIAAKHAFLKSRHQRPGPPTSKPVE